MTHECHNTAPHIVASSVFNTSSCKWAWHDWPQMLPTTHYLLPASGRGCLYAGDSGGQPFTIIQAYMPLLYWGTKSMRAAPQQVVNQVKRPGQPAGNAVIDLTKQCRLKGTIWQQRFRGHGVCFHITLLAFPSCKAMRQHARNSPQVPAHAHIRSITEHQHPAGSQCCCCLAGKRPACPADCLCQHSSRLPLGRHELRDWPAQCMAGGSPGAARRALFIIRDDTAPIK